MWCKGCLSTLLFIIVLGMVAGGAAVWNLGRFLDMSQDAESADAIVVMGGEGGRYMRTQHALELYERGVAPQVVFSGGTLLGAGLDCSSTEMSLDAAMHLGLPAEAIVISSEAQSTLDEAVNIAELAHRRGWDSMVLVTDRFHTRRSVRTLESAMAEKNISASAPVDERFDAERWWGSEQGLVFAVNEALKLAYYWREYSVRPF